MEVKKIYLAIPYTWNPDKSFQIANKVTAELMSRGHIVFSPISHSHPVADHLPAELKTDSLWWMRQDIPFVDWADEVYLVVIGENGHELIEQSKGCQMEIRHAKHTNKQIQIYEHYE